MVASSNRHSQILLRSLTWQFKLIGGVIFRMGPMLPSHATDKPPTERTELVLPSEDINQEGVGTRNAQIADCIC